MLCDTQMVKRLLGALRTGPAHPRGPRVHTLQVWSTTSSPAANSPIPCPHPGLSAKLLATFSPFGCRTALLSTFCVIAPSIDPLELDATRADRPRKELSKQIADLVIMTWLGPVAARAARAGFGRSTGGKATARDKNIIFELDV